MLGALGEDSVGAGVGLRKGAALLTYAMSTSAWWMRDAYLQLMERLLHLYNLDAIRQPAPLRAAGGYAAFLPTRGGKLMDFLLQVLLAPPI